MFFLTANEFSTANFKFSHIHSHQEWCDFYQNDLVMVWQSSFHNNHNYCVRAKWRFFVAIAIYRHVWTTQTVTVVRVSLQMLQMFSPNSTFYGQPFSNRKKYICNWHLIHQCMIHLPCVFYLCGCVAFLVFLLYTSHNCVCYSVWMCTYLWTSVS